jgi:hypothetical protein
MSDIRSVLEQRSLRKLKKSIQFSEQREAAIAHHSQVAKAVLKGERLPSSLTFEAQALRTLYYSMLKDYAGEMFAVPTLPTKRAEALWKRVGEACKKSGCSPKKFMRAQFAWFDKVFGRAPQLIQLTTDAAVQRALEFSGNADRRIVGNNINAKVSLADVFRQSEKLLRDMMRAQGCKTREEFYERFVLTELFVFPKEFLKADPAYRRVVDGG